MAASGRRDRFAFLYQSEQGTIDTRDWRHAAAPLAGIFVVATAIWLLVRPYATRGLDQRGFLDPAALAANLVLLVYALLVILLAISWVNLASKRLRDRGRTPSLALACLMPLAALLDGALHWLQPQVADVLPRWSVFVGDSVVAAALAWTIAECADLVAAPRRIL